MQWKASAPSNIALIKYMGKEEGNRSTNPSLSMTLSDFRTDVEIRRLESGDDRWEPLSTSAPLKEASPGRFLAFFQKLKAQAGVKASFEIRSGNNFPADAGLASSASSFAALTRCALTAFADINKTNLPSAREMALVSRSGSGSSCRSFFSPWCRWDGDEIGPVPSKLPALIDLVAIVEAGHKKVSSSEAHKRVRTSPLFQGRPERAAARQSRLEAAMGEGNFQRAAELSWEDLWDMHSLFHTSAPPFFYFSPDTLKLLRWAEDRWEKKGNGPISTIDAGPNVHFLVPETEAGLYRLELQALGVQLRESRA